MTLRDQDGDPLESLENDEVLLVLQSCGSASISSASSSVTCDTSVTCKAASTTGVAGVVTFQQMKIVGDSLAACILNFTVHQATIQEAITVRPSSVQIESMLTSIAIGRPSSLLGAMSHALTRARVHPHSVSADSLQ